MRDVAQRAGVSLKTVSRVINEEAGVTAGTAARVTEAVAELGFERNDLARSLRHGRSSATLGLVIEDVANPFYSAVAQAVELAARNRGFLLITASAREDAERERELVTALLRRRVDALLMVPAGPDHRYIAGSTRTVFLDRPPRGIAADTVLLDNRGGAREAVRHLIEMGHTRIACVTDAAGLYTAQERLAGYRDALHAAGLTEDPSLVRTGNRDATQAQATVEHLLGLPDKRRPTAVFTANNRNTVGALHALAQRSGRVALVGFDDFELADLLGTTVVRADPWRLGERAATIAFARLDGDDRPPRTVTVATELVLRGSGELAP
ncbi:MAG TPA: LacI family DNA-binding transcriptional regulator [Solirubrobacteraceae bacterium]|nr:LacI family DNA-binding transcriptional regulator [Solirubrobacteraceae bacterium]